MAAADSIAEFRQRVALCVKTPLASGEHRIIVTPANNLGSGTPLVITFAARSGFVVAATTFITDYMRRDLPEAVTHDVPHPRSSGVLYIHSLRKKYAHIDAKEHKDCKLTHSGTCYGETRYISKDLTGLLLDFGESAIWNVMDKELKKVLAR